LRCDRNGFKMIIIWDVALTRALDEELLSVAAQQRPREKGSKVHEDLSQQRSRLLQSVLQTFGDARNVAM